MLASMGRDPSDVSSELGDVAAPLLIDIGAVVAAFSTAIAVVVGVLVLVAFVKRFLYVCAPFEVLVFSGRRQRLSDGTELGFKVIRGGRALRVPILETVSRMDVRLMGVEVRVANAFSKGGVPLAVHAIANVKVSTDPARVYHAVERLLGKSPAGILEMARQTLEGVLREVVSQLTPEEVNEDRLKFAHTLVENAKDDFDKMGLELDVLKVQHVSDEQQYLQNLGRARIATMLRDAQNAESAAEQRVAEEQARARQRAESAAQQAEALVLQRRNAFRAEMARMEGEAKAIENEAEMAARTARATAEQELQALRAELSALRLNVETVLPAEAQSRASAIRARGDAAPTAENGRAVAEALALLSAEWSKAGAAGRELFVLQHLDLLVSAAVARASAIEVQSTEVVDGGDGRSMAALASSFPQAVSQVLDELCRTLGVDAQAVVAAPPARGGSAGAASRGRGAP
jgi:flotillin